MAKQILTLVILIQLPFGVNCHNILHKVQIAKGHSGFQRIDTDAAVSPEHIVHMQLADPLLCFKLERFGRRRKICVFIAEQLIGDLAGKEHPDIGVFMDVLTDQIHTDAGPYGGNIKGSQQLYNGFQSGKYIFPGDDDLSVITSNVIRHLLCVLQVNGILTHADGKGSDGGPALPCCNGTHQGRVQTATKEETDLCVGHKAFFHTCDQLFTNVIAHRFQIMAVIFCHCCNVAVAGKLAVTVVMSRWERQDLFCQVDQVLRLAGKDDGSVVIIAIVQGANTDRIPGGNKLIFFRVIENAGKFRIQHRKHIYAVLFV